MPDRSTIPTPAHAAGDRVHGFHVDSVTELPDLRALTYEATHAKTGARLCHVHCHDPENLFSVGFRAPVPDATGIAHVLEHCVLAGSTKYPVKDAFGELGNRSLCTSHNATTLPDHTVYEVSSPVRADLFNLADVFLDLVFRPLLSQATADSWPWDYRQALVAIGLRGCDPADGAAVESVLLAALDQVARDGLAAELIDAAFNSVSFYAREVTSSFPVELMFRHARAWFYGDDPSSGLRAGTGPG